MPKCLCAITGIVEQVWQTRQMLDQSLAAIHNLNFFALQLMMIIM